MTNLEYFQIREIIEKRSSRKNRIPTILFYISCFLIGTIIGLTQTKKICLKEGLIAIIVLIISSLILLLFFTNDPGHALQKLKEDFRDKKEIDPEDYE